MALETTANDMWQLAGTSQSALNGPSPSLRETVWSGCRALDGTVMGAESLNAETRAIEMLTLSILAGYSYNSQVSNSCSYHSFARE